MSHDFCPHSHPTPAKIPDRYPTGSMAAVGVLSVAARNASPAPLVEQHRQHVLTALAAVF